MSTRLEIHGKRNDGSPAPPHLSIQAADFVPRVGDSIKVGKYECEVTEVVFEYGEQGNLPHIVWVRTLPALGL